MRASLKKIYVCVMPSRPGRSDAVPYRIASNDAVHFVHSILQE